ncbi:xanthine dehydrogenase family protein molybdopterin-binding subunit [Aneurinibacillus migulanus]|uniref:xanthine dehydrogenase family protein molybdopterin-binding subunit n=1 Tax=Aneurinibacillus migulanus TaxID=47500 RepID=UPI00209E64D7|nr:xanthine dehydrogenase family protein molybdopterin-binding subunit [Aneurinibacillus migulanus]MCP1356315.1 xanthine dehydrogenase family protein molybdopterin-binding subunit [Aneurinibacillus migulanus]
MSIGASVKRIEDLPLLTGRGRYAGDIRLPDQCEAVLIRSPHAHANIRSIRIEGAVRMPGVLLIITAQDLPSDLPPIPMRLSPEGALEHALQFPLAKERVRYVGEPVVLIVATNRYVAEDAADAVEIEYDPLPPLADTDRALASHDNLLHPSIGSNDIFQIHSQKGSFDDRLVECPHVLQEELYVQRHTGVPLETRGMVANCGSDGRLTVYGPTKVVHFNHQILCRLLGKDSRDIRYIETDVGGGFGPRGEFYPEDYLIPYAAIRLGRPIRWIEDRAEHLLATNHSREQKHRITIGFDEVGRILALRDEIFVDTGAYIRTHGVTVPALTQAMFPGPYDIEALEFITHVVVTNKTPTGTYRGPGRFEGTFVRERIIDMVARKLKLDPADVREKNVVRTEKMPYSNGISALGQVVELDSGDYPQLLRQVRQSVDWDGFKRRKKKAAAQGKLLGLGMAMFVEKSGLGPWEYAEIDILENGDVCCKTGLADVGQGVKTMIAQVCSDQLGIPYTRVRVIHGDTDTVKKGNGSFATRGTVMGGSAAWLAAASLKDQLLHAASEWLGVPREELEMREESVVREETGQVLLAYQDFIKRCVEKGLKLHAEYTFSASHMTYPYGVHIAEVEIDKDTGHIRIVKYYIGYDIGRAINPLLIEGQLIGGMAQGLGGALYEELRYNETGQLLSGTFMDYIIPSSMEVPHIDVEIFENAPSPLNPLGVKGAGEGGTVAVAPALANAIRDALEAYDFEITSLPIRPETIRFAIRQTERGEEKSEVVL